MALTVAAGCIEIPYCFIVLKVVHPVPNSALGRYFFTFELMHKNVLHFLKRACLIVMLDVV